MAMSKKDAERAISIFESLITQVESTLSQDLSLDIRENVDPDELLYCLSTLQSTVDTMKSPLFSSLLEIKSQYEQVIAKSGKDLTQFETDPSKQRTVLKLKSDPALLSQFQQRYGITGAEIHTNKSVIADLTAEALEDSSGSDHAPFKTDTCQIQFPSTFVGDQSLEDSPTITPFNHSVSKKKTSAKLKMINSKRLLGRKTSASSIGSISLSDLASTVPTSSDKELRDLCQDSSTNTLGNVCISSESSLSSFSSDVIKPSQLQTKLSDDITTAYKLRSLKSPLMTEAPKQHNSNTGKVKKDLVMDHPTSIQKELIVHVGNGTEVEAEGLQVEEVDGPKDILFFMRDKESQDKIKELMKSKEPRSVTLDLVEGGKGTGLGMDLVGTSSTGVFVNELYSGGVAHCSKQIYQGDQVLKLNECSTGGMASFEVEMLLRQIAPGATITLLLNYNPVGWIEYQKLYQR